MMQTEQITDHMTDRVTEGCAGHFHEVFNELAHLQRHGMFCDITLFVCEETRTASIGCQGTASTDSSRLGQPAEGSTEQVTCGFTQARVTNVKLGQTQELQKEQEASAHTAATDSAAFSPQPAHSNRTSTITCVHAHKVVLAACSKVLQSELIQDSDRSEMLVGTSYEALSAIVDFMYTGKLALTRDSVDAVHARCQAWHMPAAISMCEQFEKEQEERGAMLKQDTSVTQQTDSPVRRTRGRPPNCKTATRVADSIRSTRKKVTESGQSPRTTVTELVRSPRIKVTDSVQSPGTKVTRTRSVSPLTVKTASKRRGRKKDDSRLSDSRMMVADSGASVVEAANVGSGVVEAAGSRTDVVKGASSGTVVVDASGSRTGVVEEAGSRSGLVEANGSEADVVEATDIRAGVLETEPTNGEMSLGDISEKDLPDDDAEDETPAEGVEGDKVKGKSHAYSLRPEIKRRRDTDDVTPAKSRKVCRNIVLENVLVIKGTRAKKNMHYTKTPAEIGHIQKHGFHADYLDLSLFSDASEQHVKKGVPGKAKSGTVKSTLTSEPDAESTVMKDDSVAEKEPGVASTELAQDCSGDIVKVVQMFLNDDTYSKQLQDAAIPEDVSSKKLGDKDHNYVVAQNDNLKQKGKQHGCRTCRRCHKRFRTTLQYRSHLDKCPVALACPRKNYHCRQCGVSFTAHTDYHNHRRMHIEMSKQHKPYMCNQCDFKCRVETRLVEHMYRQHGFPLENSGFEVYVCSVEGCGYQSILRNVMKHHQTRHSQERPFMCEFCGTKFKSKVTLRTHTRIHTNERMFKCTYCDSAYIQRVGLLNHIKSKHERTNEFLCSQCPFVTSLKPNLQNHMFTAHDVLPSDKTKVYQCEHCGLKTLRKSEYTNHMRRHTGVKSFACDICTHKFYTQAEINNHKKRHLNNPPKHTCPYENCNFAVFEKSKLQQHIRIRHTEKGLKPWTCYICDYRTDLKGNLTKHLRTVHHLIVHTNQKLCKVVRTTAAPSRDPAQMLTPTSCVNVNDLHVSKMPPPVDVHSCHAPPGNDAVDATGVPVGYLKVKSDIESVCTSPAVQSQGLMVGGDIGQVDTSNMRVIYSMTNLASPSAGVSGDATTDLVVMSSGVTNLPVSSLTNLSMSSPSLATSTMPLTSLTPLPAISSSLGHLRHTTLGGTLPVVPPVNVPFSQCVPVTSNSDLMPLATTTLTPLITHIPPPVPTNIPLTGQAQMAKDGGIGVMPILQMSDPNSGLYMYADNQLIPSQALSWENASQDMTQYREQTYK